MYICLDCGYLFEEPKHYTETHGLDTPPYENYLGCPKCGGVYAEAYRCDCCNKWIIDKYVKVADERYCSDCYKEIEIGEEE